MLIELLFAFQIQFRVNFKKESIGFQACGWDLRRFGLQALLVINSNHFALESDHRSTPKAAP